ncbi:MAG: hypothetical protein A3A81_01025 [Omnitrophica bacterium RIFCSPLOWO2_01_FULL_45_10b]|nr:MAG: hypothetical protein A3A81_01025 [Omnitrophica bacterium RIFCSPLOWO2_01_FULL_45_10b]
MNPYNFAMLFFSSCTFLLSLLIFLKRKDEISRIYFVFCSFVALWAIFWSIMVSENVSYEAALISSRLTHTVGGLVGVLWCHFCLRLSDEYNRYKKLLYLFYLVSFLSIVFFFSPLYVREVAPIMSFKYYTRTGPILDLYMAVFVLSVGLGFMSLNKKIEKSAGEEKIQIRGLFTATLIGFIGGFCTILPIYGINAPPYTVFMIPVYPFIMAYFMIRHRLFDIEQVAEAFQREKLATLGLLAASINHEIRNPLYAAKGLLETYVENKKDNLPTKNSFEISERALFQIDRALDVIGKLNRFAKPANKNGQHACASIPDAIQTVLDLVSYEFKLDQIDIVNQISPSISAVKADQRQLEEIFFNIIVNACHAMPEGGRLEISAEVDYNKVKVSVSDTGLGIPSGQLAHIFEPFYTTKGEKGTGLGLYVTKQLVERNGGKIFVKTKEGSGSVFTLEFKILQNLKQYS